MWQRVYDILKFSRDGGKGNIIVAAERQRKIKLEELENMDAEQVKEGVIEYLLAIGLVNTSKIDENNPTRRILK